MARHHGVRRRGEPVEARGGLLGRQELLGRGRAILRRRRHAHALGALRDDPHGPAHAGMDEAEVRVRAGTRVDLDAPVGRLGPGRTEVQVRTGDVDVVPAAEHAVRLAEIRPAAIRRPVRPAEVDLGQVAARVAVDDREVRRTELDLWCPVRCVRVVRVEGRDRIGRQGLGRGPGQADDVERRRSRPEVHHVAAVNGDRPAEEVGVFEQATVGGILIRTIDVIDADDHRARLCGDGERRRRQH